MMPPRQRLGWVVRAIPPSEGFCHGIELDDQKIVTRPRYLVQHARPAFRRGGGSCLGVGGGTVTDKDTWTGRMVR